MRGVHTFVRSDATQLAAIAAQVDAGALRVDVSDRFSILDIARVHERAAEGAFRGKVVLTPAA